MNWLQRLNALFGADYVAVQTGSENASSYHIRRVKWVGDVPMVYVHDDLSRLYPGGHIVGPCYARMWVAGTKRMANFISLV